MTEAREQQRTERSSGAQGRGRRTLPLLGLLLAAVACLAAPAARADASSTDVSYLVSFASGTSDSDQSQAISKAGATDVSEIAALRLHSVSVPADSEQAVVDALRADPSVSEVEVDRTRDVSAAPSDPDYASQWSLPQIGWDRLFGSVAPAGSANVAILDTGVDAQHPELTANVVPGMSVFDPLSDGTSDPNGHGTEMAGIVAAAADNGVGMAGIGYSGVSVMPVTVLDSQGVGQDSDIIQGIVWAADHGADVILMSFSNPGFSQGLQDAVDYAWSKGAVIVAAAGNDGSDTVNFPAGDRGVIGVANTDQNDLLNASSNSGQDVFMAAPGTGIYTTAAGGGYATITGTSASAAEVAGSAALMKATSGASNDVIDGRLAANADALGGSESAGNGRLNLERAVTDSSNPSLKPSGAAPVGEGGPIVGPYVAAAGSVSLTPNSGSPGTTVAVTSGGGPFAGNSSVTVKWDGSSGSSVTTCSTSGGGNITGTCQFSVPSAAAQGVHTVLVTDGNAAHDQTASFTVAGAATHLAFTTQPTNNFAAQPVVTVEDSAGTRVTADNSSQVTLSITPGTGTSGATLTCTNNPVTVVSGVASFSGCAINTAGPSYTLSATSSPALTPATSSAFNITRAFDLPLRSDFRTTINGNATTQTVATRFGASASSLALDFSGGNTQTSDFYSAPIVSAPSLANTDQASARVFVKNNSASGFTFTCSASFQDYDPSTNSASVILSATTANSPSTTAPANSVGTCAPPAKTLTGSGSVAAGHRLKVTITINRLSGPTTGLALLHNAPSGQSGATEGLLPSNSTTKVWSFQNFPITPTIDSLTGSGGTDSSSPFAIATGAGAMINWHAAQNGSFSVRRGGTNCSGDAGAQVASGTYSSAPSSVGTAIAAGDLASGANTLRVCVTDADANVAASENVSVTKDTIAPTTTDDVDTSWHKADVTVTLSPSDTGGSGLDKTYYTTGANPPDPTTSSAVYDDGNKPTLGDGEKIKYFSTDVAGNQEAVETSNAAKVDTAAPTTTDDVPTTVQNGTRQVTLTPSDTGGSGVDKTYYTTGTNPPDPTTSSSVYDDANKPTLGDGEKIKYFSTDVAGNQEAVETSPTLSVDTQPPSTSDDVPSAVQNGDRQVTLTAHDSGPAGVASTLYKVYSDGAAVPAKSDAGWLTYDETDKPLLHDGERIAYYSVDAAQPAGNEEDVQHSGVLSVDTEPPTISALSASPDPTNGTTALGYTLSENATVAVKVYDSGDNLVRTLVSGVSRNSGANSENWDLKDGSSSFVADGSYTYTVSATDPAGNDATPQSGTVKVDRSAPAPSLTSPTDGATLNSPMPAISGNAGSQAADASHSADGTQVTVKIWSGSSASGSPDRTLTTTSSGGNWSLPTSAWDSTNSATAPLGDGTWTVRGEQSDAAGNTGVSDARTFKVDATAPSPTLTTPADNSSLTTGTPTFSGTGATQASNSSASADSTTVTVKIYSGTSVFGTLLETLPATVGAGGAYSVPASPALGNGTYTAQTQQMDGAGNTGFSQATTFTVSTYNYNFGGLLAPVRQLDSNNYLNSVKAGSAVPVKFSLGGDKGPYIFYGASATTPSSYPVSQNMVSGSDQTLFDIPADATVTAGQSSLSYDASSQQYTYVWKTDKSWSGTYRQLVIRFQDGSYARANFHFTK